ncbi:MAG TPA: UDP-N-acetylmuramoyl-L-alanyl-D-glutamate--2,6-diaminopimelate ligase [Syntrophorhabdales bacterium]|nr:UDP-N-acetylmuramoyl-L-alanyl-D-glutamate--2,6-diaminopimelate ligase [Syntrophorhabdales bacterium]
MRGIREVGWRMRLAQLLGDAPVVSVKGLMPENVTGITKDSREVKEGFIFFATETSKPYVQEAVRKGAAVVISDAELSGNFPCLVVIRDVRTLLGRMAARFFGYPSRDMHVTGITGTNGKTTTSYLIESILRAANQPVGVMGTISYRYDGTVVRGQTTTPESTEIQRLFSRMREAGVRSAVMEVSSHALDQGRVEGIDFDGAIFTNLTHDHLDYHLDFEHYKAAKKRLFHEYLVESVKEKKYAILNKDDPNARDFVCSPPITNFTYSLREHADAFATSVKEEIGGLTITASLMGKELVIRSRLVALFNVANILAAALFGHAAGIAHDAVIEGLEALKGVPGRLERVENARGIPIFVDYAHTPDALRKTLETLKRLCAGRLIVVFGCGGDRDKTKRPLMGRITSDLADFAIITSDNPRSEDPIKIIADIQQGFGNNSYRVIENRREAIGEAIRSTTTNDVLLVAGKGHEDYQIIGTQTFHFSDREVIEEWLHVAA